MIRWDSDDLEYMEHDFVRSARKRFYAKMWFKDIQTKRRIAVYDFSGLESAAETFEYFANQYDDVKWRIGGVVNTSGEKHFLVLQRFALVMDEKNINPYRMTEGYAEIELVAP